MARSSSNRNTSSLDGESLERLAVAYVGRYATTRFKLTAYLRRKLAERGWTGDEPPPIGHIVDRAVQHGYVDDRLFGEVKARALTRRGYGARRVADALRAAGLDEADAAPIREDAAEKAWQSALAFARRRRIGPYSEGDQDRLKRQKAFAALLRAGHAPSIAQRIVEAPPGKIPDADG